MSNSLPGTILDYAAKLSERCRQGDNELETDELDAVHRALELLRTTLELVSAELSEAHGDLVEHRMRNPRHCAQSGCAEIACGRALWPGAQKPAPICEEHREKARAIVSTFGFVLHELPL